MFAHTLVLAVLCAGCWHVTVPASAAGDVPLSLVNDSGGSVCDFRMIGMDHVDGGNWVTSGAMPNAHTLALKVKPDTYAVTAEGCNGAFAGRMAVAIRGPLTLRISSTRGPRTEGSVTLVVTRTPAAPSGGAPPAGPQCLPDGWTNSNPAETPCCTHLINDLHQCCSVESEASHCMRSS